MLLPKVGGPYAYAKRAWGPFAGFVVGWSLWLAEWISLAVFPLCKKNPVANVVTVKGNMVVPVLGIVFSVYLITQCTFTQIAIGVLLLLVGIPVYIKYSPKKELTEAKQLLVSEPNIFRRMYRQEHVFLAHILHHLRRWYRRLTGKSMENGIP